MLRQFRFFSCLNALVWGMSCGFGLVLYRLFVAHLSLVSLEELSGTSIRLGLMFSVLILVVARVVRFMPRFSGAGEGLDFFLGALLFFNLQFYLLFKLASFTSIAAPLVAIVVVFVVLNLLIGGLARFWGKLGRIKGPQSEGWTVSSGLLMVTFGTIVMLMHEQIFGHDMMFGLWDVVPYVVILVVVIIGARLLQKRPRAMGHGFIAMIGMVLLLHGSLWATRWNHERKSWIKPEDTGVQKVILLTVDTLRYDMIFETGEDQKPLAPNLLKLAEESVVFHRATSPAPWTYPSFCSMMTGLEPLVHNRGKADGLLVPNPLPNPLPENIQTLTKRFRSNGWLTSAVVFNYYLKPVFMWDQGFDYYRFAEGEFMSDAVEDVLRPFQIEEEQADFARNSTMEITRLSADWIRKHKRNRYYMWIHYLDPHLPYEPPERLVEDPEEIKMGLIFSAARNEWERRKFKEDDRRWIRRLYEGEIRYVDEHIGKLLDSLRESGQFDDTLIVFTSDHGEELWEHGKYEHGHALYSEVLHVPFLIKLPGGKKASIHASVATPQLMPTVLDVCGIAYDPESLDYPSLRPLWEDGGTTAGLMPGIWSGSMLYDAEKEAYTSGTMKLIHFVPDKSVELYDLGADPGEQHDLAGERPEETERMRAALQAHVEKAIRKRKEMGLDESQEPEVTPGLVKGLKKLGYM